MTLREAVRTGAFSRAFHNRQWRFLNDSDTIEWLDGPPPSQAEIDAALIDPPPVDQSDLNQLTKQLKALALTLAQITNTPPATVRTIFKQKYDSL